jgi:uncharacterized protein YqgQ
VHGEQKNWYNVSWTMIKGGLMVTYLELLKHLRDYHAIIYTGSKEADLELITEELKEQHQLGIIDHSFLMEALTAIAVQKNSFKKDEQK